MRSIGFSTGAISLGNVSTALRILSQTFSPVVELSALRFDEFEPLLAKLPFLDLDRFSYVSVHLPSSFSAKEEMQITERLQQFVGTDMHAVLHPDSIHDCKPWKALGSLICIENMDSRKRLGRTVKELNTLFQCLPQATFCCDIAHARQLDPSMVEAYLMLKYFGDRLVQMHVSEVNARSRHIPLSASSVKAYKSVSSLVPESVPLIIESRLDDAPTLSRIELEIERAYEAFSSLRVGSSELANVSSGKDTLTVFGS